MSKATISFFRQTITGILWTGGGRVTKQVLHLITRLILARLLAPSDFGLVAMASVIIDFTSWFVDMGFGAALIQRKNLTDAHRSTAFWANVLMGWLVFIGLILSAPLVAGFFGSERLASILIALSFSTVLTPARSIIESLFTRDFKFRFIALREVLSIFLGGIVGITLALNGFGVWALVGQTLVNDLSGTVFMFWKTSWWPKLIFSRQALADLWGFTMPLTGARLFTYFNRNLDTILIGHFLSPASLGLYNLGYQLVLLPLIYITRPINQVLFATFSEIQDEPERLKNAYLHSLQLVAFITFPLMTMLALSAPELVPVLLGEKWRPAAPLFPFLCLVGLIQSIQNLMFSILQALGQTSLIFRWHLILLVGNTFAFVVGIQWGIMGIAVSYSSTTVIMAPVLFYLLLQVLDLGWSDLEKALSKAFISTIILVLTWYLTTQLLGYLEIAKSPLLKTVIQIVLAGSCYLLTSWWWNPITKDIYGRLNSLILIKQKTHIGFELK
jgi:O-antigen/teichoic acid export membrane protein